MTTAFQSNAFQNNAFQVDPVTGVIYAVDQNDTASLVGQVIISGQIYAVDENDTANLQGTVGGGQPPDTHDGFTKEEIKRYKKWKKKQAQLEAQRIQARLDKRKHIKQALQDAIDPPKEVVAQTQQTVVESPKVEKKTIDINKIDAQLARVREQQAQLLQAVSARMEAQRLHAELVARQLAELDDEESLLMLI
jgi:uncharacterized membrane protein